jgi:hypothetical protein
MKRFMTLFSYLKQNRKKIRVIYWFIVVLVMVFVALPIFFFFYLFNEDQVKQMIVDQFDSKNYHIEIGGHVSPKFWHGLSLGFSDVMVQTKNYSNLLVIKDMSCQLSWLDLVFAQYKISRAALTGVDIDEANIRKNGIISIFNVSKQNKGIFDRLTTIEIYKINTVNKNPEYKISDGAIQIKQFGVNAKFEFGFKLDDKDTYFLVNGTTKAIGNGTVYFDKFNLNVYGDAQLNATSNARYNFTKQQLDLLDIKGKLTIRNKYRGDISASKLTLTQEMGEIKQFKALLNYNDNFARRKLNLTIDRLGAMQFRNFFIDHLQADYFVEIDNNKLQLKSNLTSIKYLQTESALVSEDCKTSATLSSPNFATQKFTANLSGTCEYTPHGNLVDLDFTGDLNQEPLKLSLHIIGREKPHVTMSGSMDKLDLSRMVVNKDKLLPLFYDGSKLPFNWISLISMDGDMAIKHFAFDRITLNDLKTKFSIQDDTLKLNSVKADIYDGLLSGSGEIKKLGDDEYNIKITEKISRVNLQTLLSDLVDVKAISGKANLSMDLFLPKVSSYSDIGHNINGKVLVNAEDGYFEGVDFSFFVNPENTKLGTIKKSTSFNALEARFNFKNGASKTGSINFSSKYVIASGGGVIDLDQSEIDYNLLIKSALPHNSQKISAVLIPVSISGNLLSPKINIKNIHFAGGGKAK